MTIDDIKVAMKHSHWFDSDTMRFFGTRLSKVYSGDGGHYFVTSEKPPHGSRAYSVRRFLPDIPTIRTIGEFCSMNRTQAHSKAKQLSELE